MSKTAYTSTLKFLFKRGRTEAAIVEAFNDFARMTPCHRVLYKIVPSVGGQSAITTLSRELEQGGKGHGVPNSEQVWMASVEQRVPSKLPPIGGAETIQTHCVKVTNGDLMALEKMANQFAEENLVTKHDIVWDSRDPRTWMVMITYVVAFG